MIKKQEQSIALISFAAVLAILFMLVISGLHLSEVPTLIGQAIKAKTSQKPLCSETDEGDDVTNKGVTIIKRSGSVKESSEDYCIDEDNQAEYYCEDNKIAEGANECGCEDGACVAFKKAEEELEITPAADSVIVESQSYKKKTELPDLAQSSVVTTLGCTDSDGGKTYDEYGTATSTDDSGTDVCRTSGDLVEYYCDDNDAIQSEDVSCASGEVCYSGACITEETCRDSERRFNLYVAGRVVGTWYNTGERGEWTDKCDDSSGRVWEYYCNDAGYAYYNMKECPSDYACNEGMCIDACTDTDETGTDKGFNIYTKGTTTGYWKTTEAQGSWTDYCRSDGVLMEYTCTSGYAYSSGNNCATGYACTDGACVRTS